MEFTTREIKFKDENGQMVSALILGNGSVEAAVDDWCDENIDQNALVEILGDTAEAAVAEWCEDNIDQTAVEEMVAEDVAEIKNEMVSLLPESNASGAIAHFIDGADDIPVKNLKIGIVPKQSGSGDPSPTNVRSITGWMGATVTRTGRNMADTSTVLHGIPSLTTGASYTDIVSTIRYAYIPKPFSAQGGLVVTVYTKDLEDLLDFFVLKYKNGLLQSYDRKIFSAINTPHSFTVPANTFDTVMVAFGASAADSNISLNPFNGVVQVEYGSIATPYEPYVGNTYNISFGSAGTVYGGTLDVTTGVLTVEWVSADIASLSWGGTPSNYIYVSSYPTGLEKAIGTINVYADCYKTINVASVSQMTNYSIKGNGGNTNLYAKDDRYSTVSEWKTALSGHMLCYKLATPQTYQLNPTEVKTLLGINNIWADTGDTEVEYRADTTLYIDKKLTATKSIIAGVETEFKASKNYTTGQYLIVGDGLYKTTSNIASDATITVGTNVVSTTVAEQLIALANS